MKRILYTQRVDYIEGYGERRDAADQRLPRFLAACELLPVPVPNVPELAAAMLRELSAEGLFLSGGNDLDAYGGTTPERERTERLLLGLCRKRGLPIFGICHGMQLILAAFGTELAEVEDHVCTRHDIRGSICRNSVNSYHNLAAMKVQLPLKITAEAAGGVAEAVRHESEPIAAVMWHPEREEKFLSEDIDMVRAFFGA